MASTVEKIYQKIPIWLQNLVISYKGYELKKQRFGKTYRNKLLRLQEQVNYPLEMLENIQLEQLNELCLHASKTTKYYNSIFQNISLPFNNLKELTQVPILTKELIRSNESEFLSNKFDKKTLIKSYTSGSTGTPLCVYFTSQDFQERLAFLDRMLYEHGFKRHDKSLRLSGRTLFPNAGTNKAFTRHNYSSNQIFASTYHLSTENISHYINQIIKFNPQLIEAYPSAIYILAKYIVNNDKFGLIQPRVIITTAETLEDFQKEIIEKAFGCFALNQYASSEGAPFITECQARKLHINLDSGIFEFFENGRLISSPKPEQTLNLVVTPFNTHAYPLIRYDIGDRVIWAKEQYCSCGKNMPIVEKILGRQEDIIFSPQRGEVGRLDPVFKKCPATIIESQIVQESENHIVINVVPEKSKFKITDMDNVVAALKERVGNMEINVNIVDSIPRGANGKLKAVVNKILKQ